MSITKDLTKRNTNTKIYNMKKKKQLKKYVYRANLIRIVDGDTVNAFIDVGFNIHTKISLRLEGIDCPESRTTNLEEKEHGKRAKAFLMDLLPNRFKITSHSVDKYGRGLATLWTLDADGNTINVNKEMIKSGNAIRYTGKTKVDYDINNYNITE